MSVKAEGPGFGRLLFLGAGLILLAGVGGIVAGWLVGPPATGSSGPGGGGNTARRALAPAEELATQWQEDARLAAVSGQWLEAGMQPESEMQWTFQFFSPSTQRLAVVVVEGGVARVLRDALSPYAARTFSAREWRVDSDQAKQVWWERGGGSMVERRPDADLLMKLSVPEGGERPVWTVIGLIENSDSMFTVVVDATDGTVVEP